MNPTILSLYIKGNFTAFEQAIRKLTPDELNVFATYVSLYAPDELQKMLQTSKTLKKYTK